MGAEAFGLQAGLRPALHKDAFRRQPCRILMILDFLSLRMNRKEVLARSPERLGSEVERAAYDYQKAVETGKEVVVGVNRFQIKEEVTIPILKIDPAFERAQVERVRKVRAERDAAAATAALKEVERAARSGENLMPRIIAAVEAYATLGEVADAMRRVFGEYSEAI